MRRLLGLILIGEGVLAGLSTLRSIRDLPSYDAITITLIVAGAAVGALQLTSGVLLVERGLPGPALGRTALLLSAALTTLVVGFRLAPSDIYYWIRWEFVAGYWVYAAIGFWVLREKTSGFVLRKP